jgi:hypothetical protein
MESRAERANRYRKEANKYAEVARTGPQDIMNDVHRRLAERYTRIAEDLERQEGDLTNSLAILDKGKQGGAQALPEPSGRGTEASCRCGPGLAAIPTFQERITAGRLDPTVPVVLGRPSQPSSPTPKPGRALFVVVLVTRARVAVATCTHRIRVHAP